MKFKRKDKLSYERWLKLNQHKGPEITALNKFSKKYLEPNTRFDTDGSEHAWFGVKSFTVSNNLTEYYPFKNVTMKDWQELAKRNKHGDFSFQLLQLLWNVEFSENYSLNKLIYEVTLYALYESFWNMPWIEPDKISVSEVMQVLQNFKVLHLPIQATYRGKTQAVDLVMSSTVTNTDGASRHGMTLGFTHEFMEGVGLLVGDWNSSQFYQTLFHEIFHKADMLNTSLKDWFYGRATEEYYAHLATEVSFKLVKQIQQKYEFSVTNTLITTKVKGSSFNLHVPAAKVKNIIRGTNVKEKN